MKTALVTGSAGFLGSYFKEFLLDRGWTVDSMDLNDQDIPLDAVDRFRNTDWDIKYDLIVHAAYNVGGRASIDGVNLNLANNLMLDAAAFNYATRTGSPLLYFSSSAAYPIRLQTGAIPHALRESDIDLADSRSFLPDAHYGWAKLTGERLAEQARRMGATVYVVRPFSGYGEFQSFDYPFPSIVDRVIHGDFSVWGPPEQTRDWIHVDDVIEGCWKLIQNNDQRPTNLCTGKATTMAELMAMVHMKAFARKLRFEDINFRLDKPTGVLYRVGNPERFFDTHRPSITLWKGIERALATY